MRPLLAALMEAPMGGEWAKKFLGKLFPSSEPKAGPTPASTPTPNQGTPAAPPPVTWPKGFDPVKAMSDYDPTKGMTPDKFLAMRANKWQPKPEKWISAGGVVLQSKTDTSKVLVIKPSNNYGPWAFPKGQIDKGETRQIAAAREVWEETGIRARFLDKGADTYLGHGEGSMSITHFFLMYKVSGTPHPTNETEVAKFVTWNEAIRLFKSAGNKRDVVIAKKAMSVLGLSADD